MPKKRSTKVKPATVIAAVTKYSGIRTRVAEALGISRNTLYEYIKNNPEIAQAFEDADNTILDAVESRLVFFTQGYIPATKDQPKQTVPLNLQLDAIEFLLKTKGKSRGYSERVENDIHSTKPIVIKVDEVDINA